MRRVLAALVIVAAFAATAQSAYLKAPDPVAQVLDAPPAPSVSFTPRADAALIGTARWYPPIADLAEPFEKLAGERVNVGNNATHGTSYLTALVYKKVPDGKEVPVALPKDARVSGLRWNVEGTRCAFANLTANAVEAWVFDAATQKATQIPGVKLNPMLGASMQWMGDGTTLLLKLVPPRRGLPPRTPLAPVGPNIQESSKVSKQSSTYETRDLLKTPHDADLFQYYATSQPALYDTKTKKLTLLGVPAVYRDLSRSPDSKYILVETVQRPYSYLRTHSRFPATVELWDVKGAKVENVAQLPMAEQVPNRGVRTGPRGFFWRPTAPHTLVYAEALDEGDLANKVPFRDRVFQKVVGQPAVELFKTEQRFSGADFVEGGGRVFISHYDDDKHWVKVQFLDADDASVAPRTVWDRSSDEKYAHPGDLAYTPMANGFWAVRNDNGRVFLTGRGASPDGDRPFLDEMSLETFKTRRLFRSGKDVIEAVFRSAYGDGKTFITWRQSPSEPPNAIFHTFGSPVEPAPASGEGTLTFTSTPITHYEDPMPQLRQVKQQLVKYKRADGTPLSFKLFLPPNYKEGTKLATVVMAYPLDYTSNTQAGQVEGSDKTFLTFWGATPLWFAYFGYAVLEQTAMPVVGPVETAYDTFIEQLTANAKAAIETAVGMGVTDPERIGVMGHSHGALMTVTLLLHTDLFRAGIARSGAYNHTMRPFGFQNEHRTLYQAPETYTKLSPIMHAPKLNEPLLLIHGELDANPGTIPFQSEKLYEALRGVGATVRLVMLPQESHGYQARESIEHVIAEQLNWFDTYVKNAGPRPKPASVAKAAAPDAGKK